MILHARLNSGNFLVTSQYHCFVWIFGISLSKSFRTADSVGSLGFNDCSELRSG